MNARPLPLGRRGDDVVDACTVYLLVQWGVANDYRADITRHQAAGVRRQAANTYTTLPAG